jgi:hypothetical protein
MSFDQWLDTFLTEKGINLEDSFEVDGPSGPNHMVYQNVVDAMKIAPEYEKGSIRSLMVQVDALNGDIRKLLRHLAQAIAI